MKKFTIESYDFFLLVVLQFRSEILQTSIIIVNHYIIYVYFLTMIRHFLYQFLRNKYLSIQETLFCGGHGPAADARKKSRKLRTADLPRCGGWSRAAVTNRAELRGDIRERVLLVISR